MNLEEAVQKYDLRVQLSTHRWLVWDDMTNHWVVREHQYGKRNNVKLYDGVSIIEAIEALVNVP